MAIQMAGLTSLLSCKFLAIWMVPETNAVTEALKPTTTTKKLNPSFAQIINATPQTVWTANKAARPN